MLQHSRHVNIGSSTILECKTSQNISSSFIWWEKDGKKITIDDKHYVLQNNSLYIINITINDAGEYNCIAKNKVGTRRTRNAVLNVYG